MMPIPALKTVYGSLMHHRAELLTLGDAAHLAPYNAPPQSPVLYIKPANTHGAFGHSMHLPALQTQISARACVGLIYQPNQTLARMQAKEFAINSIVNSDWQLALLCDFALPHTSFYRPPLRFNALDGSLALPQSCMDFTEDEDGLLSTSIETWVNGICVHSYQTSDWVCSARQQLQRVSEFIAWEAGDVLMLGCPPDAPLVKAGDVVETRMNGQIFTRTLVAQEAA